MAPTSFFENHGPFTLARLAEVGGARIGAGGEPDRAIAGIAGFSEATHDEVTYLAGRREAARAGPTRAGACFVEESLVDRLPNGTVALVTDNPGVAFAHALAAFYPGALMSAPMAGRGGGDARDGIDPAARLEDGVSLEPGAVVGPGAEIGSGTVVCANAVIGAGVKIGRECLIGPCASITHALIGDRVLIHAGARIGTDGFGFVPGPRGFIKLPQVGRVIIHNDVEIGANCCVDRGGLTDTVIGEGAKIDNLVQIAHNVQVGRHCGFAAQVGLSGSSRVGDGVVMGGQAATVSHVTIGEGAQVAAGAGVWKDVEPGAKVAGRPHRSLSQVQAELRALARLVRTGGKSAAENP